MNHSSEVRLFHSEDRSFSLSIEMSGKNTKIVAQQGTIPLAALSELLEEIMINLKLPKIGGEIDQIPQEQERDDEIALFRWKGTGSARTSKLELKLTPWFSAAHSETAPDGTKVVNELRGWRVIELAGLTQSLVEGVEA